MLTKNPRNFRNTILTICIVSLVAILAGLNSQADPGAATDKDPGKPSGWADIFGSLRAKEITIDGPRLTINLPKKGGVASITITSDQKDAPLGRMMDKLAFKKVHLKDGTFVFRTPSGFTQTIYAVNATITGDKNSNVLTAKGQFTYRGEKLSFDVSAAQPSDKPNSGILPISVLLEGENLSAQLAGNINLIDGLEIKGKLKLLLRDLKFISAWLGYPIAKDAQTLKLDADGEFSWVGSVLSFSEANFNIGKSEAEGAISIDLADARPRFDGTMAFDEVDLRKLSRKQARLFKGGSAKSNNDSKIGVGGADKAGPELKEDITDQYSTFAATYLNGFDADLRLSAERVLFTDLEALDCALTMTLRSGNLLFGLVESKIAGGQVHGELSLKNGALEDAKIGRIYNLRADLENIEAQTLAQAFELPGLISGPAHIKLDVGGRGNDLEAITKSLSGEMKIKMDGPVRIANGASFIKHLPEDADALKWWLALNNGATFRSFENTLTFKNGLVSADQFSLQASDMRIDGQGSVNIVEQKGNILLSRIRVAGTGEEPAGGFEDSSANNVRIRGPWKHLFIAPDDQAVSRDQIIPKVNVPGRQGADTGGNEATAIAPDRG